MVINNTVPVEDLKPHPQNNYFFDDMEGDTWAALLESIASPSGVTNAITIDQDYVIISGHQRVRACKVLGIKNIPYIMIDYRAKESDDDRREKLEIKDLIESNIRQRVVGNANPVKLGRCFKFLNEWYGFKNGGDRKSEGKVFPLKNSDDPKNQTELAESYGITKHTMTNYMRLAEMIPELEELVDTGIVSKDTALAMMKQLSTEEQEELIKTLDVTKKITKTQMQSTIDAMKRQQEAEITDFRNDLDEIKGKYSAEIEKNKLLQDEIDKYHTVGEKKYKEYICDSCALFATRVAAFIKEVGGYVWLADKINEIPADQREGYILAVRRVKEWAESLEYNINKEKGDILV